MMIVNRSQLFKAKKRRLSKFVRPSLYGLGGLFVAFLLANALVWAMYRGEVLPNHRLGNVEVGSIPLDQLDKKVAVKHLLPEAVVLKQGDKQQQVLTKDLGVGVDWQASKKQLAKRPLLPFLTVFTSHAVPVTLTVNDSRLEAADVSLSEYFGTPAKAERISLQNDNFVLEPPEGGKQLDTSQFRTILLKTLSNGRDEITMPLKTLKAPKANPALAEEAAALQKQLDAKVTLTYGSKTKKLSRSELVSLYEVSGQSMKLSPAKISELVAATAKSFGITAHNQTAATSAVERAVSRTESLTFVLTVQNSIIRRYCTAVRGIDASFLPELQSKLAVTYGDPRGWNNGGRLSFIHVTQGCDFTVWLSAPSSMTSFGGACDSYYSCRSGPNVVINHDRWMGATDPWNAAGGSLEDYRVMVINHETGHWLGFGHSNCPDTGQPAPVMQQQSINLQGCTFNPWPTAAELAKL